MPQSTQIDSTAHDHFKAGRLREAIAAAGAQVKAAPAESSHRMFLAELLCFAGDFDRTDVHLDAVSRQRTDLALTVALFRQVIRAEEHRRQFHRDGRAPELIGDASTTMRARLEASVMLRTGDLDRAAALLEEANAPALRAATVQDGEPVEFRDLDDLTCGVLEACTANGGFYWIEFARIEQIRFEPVKRPFDVLWRAATVTLRDGPELQVYAPSLYAGAAPAEDGDEQIALGRATAWTDRGGIVRGAGHRLYLLGDEAKPAVELKTLFLNP